MGTDMALGSAITQATLSHGLLELSIVRTSMILLLRGVHDKAPSHLNIPTEQRPCNRAHGKVKRSVGVW